MAAMTTIIKFLPQELLRDQPTLFSQSRARWSLVTDH
jgi:hypothetical protein